MVEFTNNLPTPGPENIWGAELNAAINERVDYLNTEVEAIKTSLGTNTNLFRGAWQAPANFLLWSSLFSSNADINLFSHVVDESVIITGPLVNTTSDSSGASVGISSTTALRYETLMPARSETTSTLTLDLSGIPSVKGRYVSRIEYMVNPVNTTGLTLTLFTINEVEVATLRNSVTNAWISRVDTINLVDPKIGFKTRTNTSTSTQQVHKLYLAEMKIYGTANNQDLYQTHHVVSHAGKFWRSLYDNNSDEPSAESPTWVEVADFPAP